MHLLNRLLVILSCTLTLSQTQTYNRYPVQKRRSGYRYSEPSVASLAAPSYYTSRQNPSYAHSYNNQRNVYPYATARPYSELAAPSNGNYRNSISSESPYNPTYRSTSESLNTKQYLSNSYNSENIKKLGSSKVISASNRVSRADAENAKFVGAENQEHEEVGRTHFLKRKKIFRRFGGILRNPCSPYGRDAGKSITPPPKEQGRFLWDVNVYNVFPQSPVGLGCGGYGGFGGGLGGGLLSDPITPSYYPPDAGIVNFLSLFAPGVLQNSFARPQHFADYGQPPIYNDLQSDPEVDPNYRPGADSVPVRRPNRVFYDSAGAPPVTPAKIVGGISTTVNNIIQELTGNVQPVYG